MSTIENSFYLSVSSLSRMLEQMAFPYFQEYQLAVSHVLILLLIKESDKISPSQLSNMLNLSPSTITRLVDKLEKKQLIKRVKSGKNILIILSSQAEKIIPQLEQSWESYQQKIATLLGQELNDKIAMTLLEVKKVMEQN